LKKLAALGYRFIIVSNQSGIARGYFTEKDLIPVRQKLESLLSQLQIHLDGFYFCPHHPQGTVTAYRADCDCRKPMPGLILRAAAEHDIDVSASWMIGDILNDVEAGKKAGCKTILIDNGNETEWIMNDDRRPDYIVHDLSEAADVILNHVRINDGKEVERL